MTDVTRRGFLRGAAASLTTASLATHGLTSTAQAAAPGGPKRWASFIDLGRCDGCPDRDTPRCVAACRSANAHRFPEPDPAMLKDYWPQPRHEDWSSKRDVTDRLTPYNWTFVQRVQVEHEGESVDMNIPRRCMHCDNPPCVKLCPFGAMKQSKQGPTYVDESACMGGAKCRAVCPWDVPQRQAGVGLYTSFDPLPVGGGVMYKCDLCQDELAKGNTPACATECPRGAIHIGEREAIFAEAEAIAREYGGERYREHLYGRYEHGGTSTHYVSRVPFAKIDAALVAQTERKREQLAQKNPEAASRLTPMRLHGPANVFDESQGLAIGALAAPFVGAAAAIWLAAKGARSRVAAVAAETAARHPRTDEEKRDAQA